MSCRCWLFGVALLWGCQAQAPQSSDSDGDTLAGLCSMQKGREQTPDLCGASTHTPTRWPVVIVHGLSGNPFNGQTAEEWEAEPQALEDMDGYLRSAIQLSAGCRPCDTMLREAASTSEQSQEWLDEEVFAPVHTACRSSAKGHALGFCCGSPVMSDDSPAEQRFYVAHLPPYQPSEVRGQCLLAQVEVFRAMYQAPKVHAIGHSQGGADVFVAARGDQDQRHRQVFATVTALQTPFGGTPVAELVRVHLRKLVERGVDVGHWLQAIVERAASSPSGSFPTGIGPATAALVLSHKDFETSMEAAIEMIATWITAQNSDNVTGVDLWNMLEQHAGFADVYPLNQHVRYQTFAGVGIPSITQFWLLYRQVISTPGALDWTGLDGDDGLWAYAQAYLKEYLARADTSCHGLYAYPIAPGVNRLSDLPDSQWWRLRRTRPELGLQWQLATGAVASAEDIEPNDGMSAVSSAALGDPWAVPLGALGPDQHWPYGEVSFRGCLPAEHGDPFGIRSLFDRIGFVGPDHTHECTGFSYLCFLRTLLGELAAVDS